MSDIEYWTKFIKGVKYAVTVDVHEDKVTIDIELFHNLMTKSNWRLEEHLIKVEK